MDMTPIRRTDSSPVMQRDLNQVMSPNLDARMGSGSSQLPAEQDVDPATARAILQSWSEAKGEDGSMPALLRILLLLLLY